MSTNTSNASESPAELTRRARAAFVGDSLRAERWSIRQAALALGMSHTALASRVRAETAFLADEIEGIAHLLRADPMAYYGDYLSAGTRNAPTPEGEGVEWAPRGSNPRPADYRVVGSNVVELPSRPAAYHQPHPLDARRQVRPIVRLHDDGQVA